MAEKSDILPVRLNGKIALWVEVEQYNLICYHPSCDSNSSVGRSGQQLCPFWSVEDVAGVCSELSEVEATYVRIEDRSLQQ